MTSYYLVGIKGTGMASLAVLLSEMGDAVRGCDTAEVFSTDALLAKNHIPVDVGFDASLLPLDCQRVIYSSAYPLSTPVLAEAQRRGRYVASYNEFLAHLTRERDSYVVAGTHGKTTTTTMVATLLDKGGFDPTVINGGIIHAYGSNARAGEGEWMVVEADESDGSFNRLPATIAIVTNIDPEHMEHWGTIENLRQGFYDFVTNIPFYGMAVCCTDHPEVQALVGRVTDRRVTTFGFNAQADVRAVNLSFSEGRAHFDVLLQNEGAEAKIEGCSLPMPGNHNVSNSLAAIAVARHLGMKKGEIREALAQFGGVNRRFTKVGEVLGGVTIIDDYGHHPVEIAAVLKAARQYVSGTPGARVIAAHQPHRFSRLHSLFDDFCTCFNEADVVAIADVYAAGEDPIPGATRDDLVAGLIRHGHRHARALFNEEDLARLVKEQARPGDIVVCLGAGTISAWANNLPNILGA